MANLWSDEQKSHQAIVKDKVALQTELLYVLPIFSYDPIKHTDVYHPLQNNESKSDLYLLKKEDYSFIQHDSVMKLNDIRTVSINRILYHQKDGRIDINSNEYKTIEELVLNKYFPSFLYELRKKLMDKENLERKCREQEQKIIELQAKIIELENILK